MTFLRLLGRLLLLFALVDVGLGVLVWLAGHDVTRAAGETWFALHTGSLNLAQAVIQRYLHPAIWDSVAVPILQRPFWEAVLLVFISLLVLGGLIGLIGRRR